MLRNDYLDFEYAVYSKGQEWLIKLLTILKKNRVSTTEIADCKGKVGLFENANILNQKHFKVGKNPLLLLWWWIKLECSQIYSRIGRKQYSFNRWFRFKW